eukprot:gene490-523_t
MRVSDTVSTLHDLWVLPFQIALTVVFLYIKLKVAFFAGLGVILVIAPITAVVTSRIRGVTTALLRAKDQRVALVGEALRNIKSVKMTGYAQVVETMLTRLRKEELKYLLRRKLLDAVCVFLWAASPVLVPCATFGTLAALDLRLSSATIFSSLALLNMLNFPINAFPWVVNGAVEGYLSLGRIRDVLAVAWTEKGKHVVPEESVEEESAVGGVEASAMECDWGGGSSGGFRLGPFSLQLQGGPDPQVWGVCGTIGSGKSSLLLSLIGETRLMAGSRTSPSGRVSYCSQSPALFRGTVRTNITLGYPMHRARYLAVLRGTGLLVDFESENWKGGDTSKVGPGGGRLSGGQRLRVGVARALLSGGQRLRVGVARALYAPTAVVLLDDPFSSLDQVTATGLMSFLHEASQGLNGGPGRLIIIATHSVGLLSSASNIILLHHGNVDGVGGYEDMLESSPLFRSLLSSEGVGRLSASATIGVQESWGKATADPDPDHDNEAHVEDSGEDLCQSIKQVESPAASSRNELMGSEAADRVGDLVGHTEEGLVDELGGEGLEDGEEEEEGVEVGYLKAKVVIGYLKAAGTPMITLVILSIALMQFSYTSVSLWWAWWADRQDSISTSELFLVLAVILSVAIAIAMVRSVSFAVAGVIAAENIYEALQKAVLETSMTFFESQPLGRLLNRFGKDAFCVDDQIPFVVNIVLSQVFSLTGSVVIIASSNYPVILVLIIVGFVYYRLQRIYRCSSRQYRRLEAKARSPVFSFITDCLSSGPTIRAQALEALASAKFERLVDSVNRITLSSNIAAQWIAVRLQLLGAFITASLALSACLSTAYHVIPVAPGILGLALTYSLSIVSSLSGLLTFFAEAELEMVSVERLQQYCDLPAEDFLDDVTEINQGVQLSTINTSKEKQTVTWWGKSKGSIHDRDDSNSPLEEPLLSIPGEASDSPSCSVPSIADWPRDSSVVFDSVSLRYGLGQPLALSDISFRVDCGARVAIVGRTGSGKSSLFRILLRLSSYSGSVVVGGLELKTVPRSVLRDRVSVVPQDTLLFSGSIRMNLDPHGARRDSELLWTLRKSGLYDSLRAGKGQDADDPSADEDVLGTVIGEAGAGISQGQRQLLGLARAFLHPSPLLFVDEASSQLDHCSEVVLKTALQQHLDSVKGGVTMLMIAHRKHGLRELCNMELKLDSGKVVKFEAVH